MIVSELIIWRTDFNKVRNMILKPYMLEIDFKGLNTLNALSGCRFIPKFKIISAHAKVTIIKSNMFHLFLKYDFRRKIKPCPVTYVIDTFIIHSQV